MKLTESLLKQLWYLAIDNSLEVFAQNKAPTILAAQSEAPELGEALRELVRLKDLKDRLEASVSYVGRGSDEQEYAHTKPKAWESARAALASNKAAAVAAGEPMTTVERTVIEDLLTLTSDVFQALDNSEEREGDDGREHAIDATWFDPVSEALDKLEALPDDQPGYTMDAPAKAGWALRNLLAVPPAPIASASESVGSLVVKMDSHDNGQSLAPSREFKIALAYTNKLAESLPVGKYPLYTHPAAAQLSRAEVPIDWRKYERGAKRQKLWYEITYEGDGTGDGIKITAVFPPESLDQVVASIREQIRSWKDEPK